MKNSKWIDFIYTAAWIIFFLGVLISTILITDYAKTFPKGATTFIIDVTLFVPIIVCPIVSYVLLFLFFFYKKQYLTLIRMHIKKKWIFYMYTSLYLTAFYEILGVILFFITVYLKPEDIASFYLYVVLAILMLINIVAVTFMTISKFMMKVDLAVKRRGQEFKDDELSKIIQNNMEKENDNSTKDLTKGE